jgi:hypothetical protein
MDGGAQVHIAFPLHEGSQVVLETAIASFELIAREIVRVLLAVIPNPAQQSLCHIAVP